MTAHLGLPIPSPAIMGKIGTAFRGWVDRFAEDEHIPVVRFKKDDRKIEVMRSHLARQGGLVGQDVGLRGLVPMMSALLGIVRSGVGAMVVAGVGEVVLGLL
jgi:hypothetical protein